MSKIHLKLLLWAVLLAAAIASGLEAVALIASLIAYFNAGANPAAALHIVPNVPPDLHVRVVWRPIVEDIGRPMEPLVRADIQSAYVRAWLQMSFSFQRNEPFGLKTYFSGPALAQVDSALRSTALGAWRISQVDTRHELELHFYSADGAIVSLTDHDAVVAQIVRDATGRIVFTTEQRATYHVIMYLQDGNWRIQHWVRDSAEDLTALKGNGAPSPGLVAHAGDHLVLDGDRFVVAGVNYSPRDKPWDKFWPTYDGSSVQKDFALVKSLGLNVLRILVPFEQFGGAVVDPAMLDRLVDLLDRARGLRLKVVVTLFEQRVDFTQLLWPDSDRHIEAIMSRLKNHPAILAWDLKSAPELAYLQTESALVDAWLVHTACMSRLIDPAHLITIGWSNSSNAGRLADAVDVLSFELGRNDDPDLVYKRARSAYPGRPLLVAGFEFATANGPFAPGHTEQEQAARYADVLRAIRADESAGSLASTLFDYSYVPRGISGFAARLDWQNRGVVRLDGAAKPAADLLRPGAELEVERPSWFAYFEKPFWLCAAGLAVAVAWAARAAWRFSALQSDPRVSPLPAHVPKEPSSEAVKPPRSRNAKQRRRTRKRGKR